jgi:hypothetical protein
VPRSIAPESDSLPQQRTSPSGREHGVAARRAGGWNFLLRKRYPDRPDDFFIKPRAIADETWHVVHQDRSAWSFNVELRPFGEKW